MFLSDNSSAVVNRRSSDFDVELCHAFLSAVSRSDLICKPCKRGLIQRYLQSKARNDLVFKVYRRINEMDRPLLVRLMHEVGGPEDFQRAIQDLNDVPNRSEPPEAASSKQWDCVENEAWGNLHIWLRILAKEESVIPHPLAKKEFKTSAWRSRVWAAVAGRYTLEDLKNRRSIRRFLDDHEGRLLESSLWIAEARIPKLAKYEITHAACECFPLGDRTVTFQDIIQKLIVYPEILRDPAYIRRRHQAIVDRLIEGCFDSEIVEGVFQRCAPPAASETADPFVTFVAYWESAPVRHAVRSLLGLVQETFTDAPAVEQVAKPEKKPVSKPFSLRRGATVKHPSVDIGFRAYHPLTSRPRKQGPIDYEGEARNFVPQYCVDTEDWLDNLI